MDGPSDALFVFGWGLSYTSFDLTDLVVTPTTVSPTDNITITLNCHNTGGVAGATVVQVGSSFSISSSLSLSLECVFVPKYKLYIYTHVSHTVVQTYFLKFDGMVADASIQVHTFKHSLVSIAHPCVFCIQVYFRDPVARVIRIASVQLLRFARTEVIAPGASVPITITAPVSQFAYWDDGQNDNGLSPGWVVDPGEFELFAGFAGFGSWSNPGGLKATVTVHS